MIRAIALVFCLAPAAALAQSAPDTPADMMAAHKMMHGQHMMQGGAMMQGQQMMMGQPADAGQPTQAGQSAFAAIQEIVDLLVADPKTDWSKVDIEALRRHLIDMNNVTLAAKVAAVPIDGGMRFDVTGDGPVRDSIRRMAMAHAATMNGVGGWTFAAADIDGGAALTVHAPAKDADKLRGLGFVGVLTLGMHHQMHHLMIARGADPHG